METLIKKIKQHEGFRQKPYKDTEGILTIGYGFNLVHVGISEDEADLILRKRVKDLQKTMMQYSWFANQNRPRREALLDMAYNLGVAGLLKFKKMIAALVAGDYETAAIEALNSRWAAQVKGRANTIADVIQFGEWGVL
jgi:lysozyme